MNIDTGTAVVIGAVLVFYLRLIIIQREKAKRARAAQAAAQISKKKKARAAQEDTSLRYSILTQSMRNRVIAGFGVALMVVGAFMNAGVFQVGVIQAWWWVPTALGILAFSWLFAL